MYSWLPNKQGKDDFVLEKIAPPPAKLIRTPLFFINFLDLKFKKTLIFVK